MFAAENPREESSECCKRKKWQFNWFDDIKLWHCSIISFKSVQRIWKSHWRHWKFWLVLSALIDEVNLLQFVIRKKVNPALRNWTQKQTISLNFHQRNYLNILTKLSRKRWRLFDFSQTTKFLDYFKSFSMSQFTIHNSSTLSALIGNDKIQHSLQEELTMDNMEKGKMFQFSFVR